MATSQLTRTINNAPYGLDLTQSRIIEHGSYSFGAGNYTTGGLLPNWNPTTETLSPTQDVSGQNVLVGHYTQATIGIITAVTSASSGATTTIYTAVAPAAGTWVTFSGLTTATALNGLTLQVATSTTGSFTVASAVPTQSKTADTGQFVVALAPDDEWIESVAGSGFIYQRNKTTAAIQIFTTGTASGDALNELAAGALPAGVTGDTISFESEWVRA
jgi:hypothetical protein